MRPIRVKWAVIQSYRRNAATGRGGNEWIIATPEEAANCLVQWSYGTAEEWDSRTEVILVRTTDSKLVQIPISAIVVVDVL